VDSIVYYIGAFIQMNGEFVLGMHGFDAIALDGAQCKNK
jgi:hypothetical protein